MHVPVVCVAWHIDPSVSWGAVKTGVVLLARVGLHLQLTMPFIARGSGVLMEGMYHKKVKYVIQDPEGRKVRSRYSSQ